MHVPSDTLLYIHVNMKPMVLSILNLKVVSWRTTNNAAKFLGIKVPFFIVAFEEGLEIFVVPHLFGPQNHGANTWIHVSIGRAGAEDQKEQQVVKLSTCKAKQVVKSNKDFNDTIWCLIELTENLYTVYLDLIEVVLR